MTRESQPDPTTTPGRRRLFRPLLAGATARDRAIACVGAAAGIALVGLGGAIVNGDGSQLPWIVAPMGATAVLLFAVPTSPLAQPWPVIGGSLLSAVVGLAAARLVADATLAAGLAVGLAIGAMSLTRCLHPPGGAVALLAALGGPEVTSADLFPLAPVGLNAVGLVAVGWAFHKLAGHSYPHRTPTAPIFTPPTSDLPASERVGFRAEDIDAVLAQIGDAYDIGRDDLALLLREVETRALVREHGELTCAEIMSLDVIAIDAGAPPAAARRLLLESGVRLLPVLDPAGRAIGGVGLRELEGDGATVGDLMTDAPKTAPDRPAIELTRPLTDGRHHAVIVVDPDDRLLGLVTQTDLLAAIGRRLDHTPAPAA